MSKRSWIGGLALLLLLGLSLSGCHVRPLLYDVSVSPDQISPNADGNQDATNIAYKLSRNASLSIYFQNTAGERFYFRNERPRSAGEYQVQWGGSINQNRWLENEYGRELVKSWVLPDGVYTWVLEASDEGGNQERAEGQITISGADSVVPQLRKFRVALPVFTPNQDGLADRTGISYDLNKDVESVQVYLYDPAEPEVKYPLEEQKRTVEEGQAGPHYYDYDGGVDRGADPPPDGTYVVVGEARDRVGHHVVVSDTLTIKDGGKPRAVVVNATIHWSDAVRSLESTEVYLPLGSTLCFTTYVENYGRVPIRTSGPPSGTPYRSDQNFNTLAVEMGDDSFYEQAGAWRFGIRFDTSELDFPYRWAVGRPEELRCEMIEGQEQCFLDPGQRGTVSGCIELVGPFPRNQVFAWGGLIHQWVGVSDDNNYIDRVLIHIGEP
ncbi:MAG: gliding motility-associated C-terminal domain-containing protein [Anaerolineae bacterium]